MIKCTFGLFQIRKRSHDSYDPISLLKFSYKFNPIWIKAQLYFLICTDQCCGECGVGPFQDFRSYDKHRYKIHHSVVVR